MHDVFFDTPVHSEAGIEAALSTVGLSIQKLSNSKRSVLNSNGLRGKGKHHAVTRRTQRWAFVNSLAC